MSLYIALNLCYKSQYILWNTTNKFYLLMCNTSLEELVVALAKIVMAYGRWQVMVAITKMMVVLATSYFYMLFFLSFHLLYIISSNIITPSKIKVVVYLCKFLCIDFVISFYLFRNE